MLQQERIELSYRLGTRLQRIRDLTSVDVLKFRGLSQDVHFVESYVHTERIVTDTKHSKLLQLVGSKRFVFVRKLFGCPVDIVAVQSELTKMMTMLGQILQSSFYRLIRGLDVVVVQKTFVQFLILGHLTYGIAS